MTRDMEVKAEENFPITACGYTKGKLSDGNQMWHISGHKCKQILNVQVLLYEMQELAFLTKIHFCHNQDSSWQWTICRCFVHYTCHTDHPKS